MAQFDMNFPDDLFADLLDTQFEEIAVEALDKASPELNRSVQSSLIASASRGYSKGEMQASIKATKPKRTKTDAFIVVSRPTGRDKKGVRNMEKAAYLEYGTSKQAARPWLANATNNAQSTVLDIAQKVYSEKVGAK